MNKPITNDKVTRWLLLLQEFYITILDRPGKENVVAEFLSRIHNEGELIPINDNFPDEHLFTISTKSPWFADIVNYIAT
jgi:ABC-type sulfate transport system substrate-binding protein